MKLSWFNFYVRFNYNRKKHNPEPCERLCGLNANIYLLYDYYIIVNKKKDTLAQFQQSLMHN